MRFVLLIAIVASYGILGSRCRSQKSKFMEEKSPLHRVIRNAAFFSNTFFSRFTEFDVKDVALSPLSIYIILSMLSYGARGNAQAQLEHELRLANGKSKHLKPGFKDLLEVFARYKTHGLSFNTQIHIPNNLSMSTKFTELVTDVFRASVKNVNLDNRNATEALIMNWFKAQSNSTSDETFSSEQFIAEPNFILLNSLHFKSLWQAPFSSSNTEDRPFYPGGFQTFVRTPTMYRRGSYRYGNLPNLDARFVEVPYQCTEAVNCISMFIILPNERKGYKTLLLRLGEITIAKLLRAEMREIDLYLPKFTVKSKDLRFIERIPIMTSITQIFGSRADFSGIFETTRVQFGAIANNVDLEIDENGVVSGANNGIFYEKRARRDKSEVLEFRVEHPFLAFISTVGHERLNLLSAHISGLNFVPPMTGFHSISNEYSMEFPASYPKNHVETTILYAINTARNASEPGKQRVDFGH